MTTDTRLDTGPLSWVKPEIDQALQRASDALQAAEPARYEQCRADLHMATGALRMAKLYGPARFTEALESAFTTLLQKPDTAELIAKTRTAITALKAHINEVLATRQDLSLRLLPIYQDLLAAQGVNQVSGCDLFFPIMDGSTGILSAPELSADALAKVQQERERFQQGLLAWMRDNSKGIDVLQDALREVHQLVGLDNRFWWIALALTEAVSSRLVDAGAEIRRIFARIDSELVRLTEGATEAAPEILVRQMLYYIGRAKCEKGTAHAVRDTYALDHYFPAEELPVSTVAPMSAAAMDALKQAQEQWTKYYGGEQKRPDAFLKALKKLQTQCRSTQRPELDGLLTAVAELSKTSVFKRTAPNDQQSLAMATVLIVAEELFDQLAQVPVNLHNRIAGAINAMQTAWGKEPTRSLKQVTEQMQTEADRHGMFSQIAPQLLKSLAQIESLLDESFRELTQAAPAAAVTAELRQLEAAFQMLNCNDAASIVTSLRQQMSELESLRKPDRIADQQRLAEIIASLHLFVQSSADGRQDSHELLQGFLDVGSATVAMAEPPHASAQPTPTPAADFDTEIVEIFLEEAQEVLAAMREEIARWEQQAANSSALKEIRRGFHTLKGSSRVAGLNEFGEYAWGVERTLNKCLEGGEGVPDAVVNMVRHAQQFFSQWCQAGLDKVLDGSPLMALVEAAQADLSLDATVAMPPKVKPSEAVPIVTSTSTVAEAPEDEIEFEGGIVLSAGLFEIFIAEATQHLKTLRDEMAALRFGRPVRHEFMRVAHTMAGIARTVGMQPLADLSYALEKWLQHLLVHAVVPETQQLLTMEEAILALGGMVDTILQRRLPVPAVQLVQDLTTLLSNSVVRMETSLASARAGSEKAQDRLDLQLTSRAIDSELIDEDLDSDLLAVFLEEALDLASAIGADLRAWRAEPTVPKHGEGISRVLHTLKGSARAVGAMRLGERVHKLENEVEQALKASTVETGTLDSFEREFDRWCETFEALQLKLRHIAEAAPAPTPAEADQDTAARVEAQKAIPTLRVRVDIIDHMVDNAGEISLARSRIEGSTRTARGALSDITASIAQLRNQLREIEIAADSQLQSRLSHVGANEAFDPLEFDRYTRLQEVTRIMAESVHDLSSLQINLRRQIDEVDAALQQQLRANRDLQQVLLRIQTIPFASVSERLHRIVRQTASELQKKVTLVVRGGHVELDRGMLESLMAPLEHMLRNAIAHGIETPDDRDRAGKNESGQISISLRQEANQIFIDLFDDGAGLDTKRIRAKGEKLGMLKAGAKLSDRELIDLIFRPGFSTADALTEIAGRGIGMDVVRNVITGLGGHVEVGTKRGKETRFTIALPLTLAVTQAVFVKAGSSMVAIPSNLISQIQLYRPAQLDALYELKNAEWQGQNYPFHYLPTLLGHGAQRPASKTHSMVMLLASGEDRLALHVDELHQNQEVAIKDIGAQLAGIPGVAGATISSNGDIVFILNPLELARRQATVAEVQTVEQVDFDLTTATVMVVDDSLTVRKVTSRLLSRAGYSVMTAKDGVDALEQLQTQLPTAILLDIEMPRMDGFELTKYLRNDPRTRHIPIIMISSRTAEKHQQHAAQLGVNRFFGKPYQDEELLRELAIFANLEQTIAMVG